MHFAQCFAAFMACDEVERRDLTCLLVSTSCTMTVSM